MKILLFILFISKITHAQEFSVPAFSTPVVDQAQILRGEVASNLAQKLSDIYRSGGPQVAVLTVPNLNGVSIEEASIKVVDQWQLGRKGKDDGVLLFVSRDDHKMRIEVGRGLEGDLTDAVSKLIIVNVIRPEFKAGNFEGGVISGVNAILEKVYPQGAEQKSQEIQNAQEPELKLWQVGLIIMIVFFLFLRSLLRRLSPFSRSSGGWGGGFGGGGGGGSSSSDSGGGGGFSGGGSSGDW